ncbi:hypothetical protein E2562_025030 [Oryza meyeriana var. granulata]|uniref:Uncharacterized protein n=1 Tax=Oryza meyeriana var. granulata TaxID=110450 RepID=A0A6G1FC49_9ORYZ|nr:hypothetical protein E2562_025030 [Oryza meyeriana var. granulata]
MLERWWEQRRRHWLGGSARSGEVEAAGSRGVEEPGKPPLLGMERCRHRLLRCMGSPGWRGVGKPGEPLPSLRAWSTAAAAFWI